MTTYADPTRCPDCHALLPQTPQVCPVCSLPLAAETAISLFRTLQEADRLLGVLRLQKPPSAAVATVSATAATGSRLAGVQSYPTASRPVPRPESAGLRGSSVPRILLSLGALCLLVAAVTFLAVAWSWLGVSGRTVVLLALTAASLGLALTLLRRGFRMAAEALSVVGLGFLAIDVTGARHAGWLGTIDDAQLSLVTGAVVAAGALLLLVASASRPLVAPGLVAPVAVLVATAGAQMTVESLLPTVVGLLVLLGLGRVGTVVPSAPLQVASVATGALAWLYLAAAGYDQAGDPVTVTHYLGELAGWPILAATLVAAAAGPVTGIRRVEVGGYAVAGLAGTYGVLLPVVDNAPTAMTSALLASSAVWVVALFTVPQRLRRAALLPMAGTLVVPAVAAAALVEHAVAAVTSVGAPFSQPFDVHVSAPASEVSPLMLLPTVLTIAAAGCAVAELVAPLRRIVWAIALGGALVLGVVATLPLYDVPLAVVVGVLLLTAVGGFVAADRLPDSMADVSRLGVLVLTTGATLLALPSDQMVTAVLLVACGMAGRLMARTDTTGAVAALCFPIAFGAFVWAGGSALGVDPQLRAVPVLLVLGGLAIWRPQPELEASSALVGALVATASVTLAQDLLVSLAVHLTVAGVLVTISSIVNPTRRMLAWPGGLLLAAATWVRLFDLGVHVPEAYTLPSALALIAVGAWRLREDDRSATLRVLAPGLALATVPSLLATLDDPYSLRALLLGLGCLALVLAGVAMHWSAPLVVGAGVGGLLVLRELAPYAAEVPTWLSIGISGAVLLLAGITWESRMHDVRRASHYVAALR